MDQNLKKFITDLESQYENLEKDIDTELVLREVGLRFTELRLISGLSRTEFAEKGWDKAGTSFKVGYR